MKTMRMLKWMMIRLMLWTLMAHNDANDGGDDDHHHLVVMNMTAMNKTSKTWKRSPEGKGKHKVF